MIDIIPSDSKSGSIYGLPKIRKLNVQRNNLFLSPIVSYRHLSKFLTGLLDPVILISHCTKDSFVFCEEIKKVSPTNRFLLSYDVYSLFNSIPLKETINIAINLLFAHDPGLKIIKDELEKLIEFATSRAHFLFQDAFSDQVDGVAMGSLLGPVLANLFMGYFKTLFHNFV